MGVWGALWSPWAGQDKGWPRNGFGSFWGKNRSLVSGRDSSVQLQVTRQTKTVVVSDTPTRISGVCYPRTPTCSPTSPHVGDTHDTHWVSWVSKHTPALTVVTRKSWSSAGVKLPWDLCVVNLLRRDAEPDAGAASSILLDVTKDSVSSLTYLLGRWWMATLTDSRLPHFSLTICETAWHIISILSVCQTITFESLEV